MGLRSYFGFGPAREVEDRTLPPSGDAQAPSLLSWTPPGSVTPTNALQGADVYAAVRCLSDAAASLPLHVYRRVGEGRERVDNATAELLRRPDAATTTPNLIGQLMAHLNLHGNAFLGKWRGQDGSIEKLALLAPDRVQVEVRAGRPSYVVTGLQGRATRHGTEDIIHVKALSTDGLVGLSPIRQCRVALGLASDLAEHAQTFFANDATPRGLLRLEHFGDASAQVAELREGFEGQHKGVANAHRIAVVSGEVSFSPISLPPEDAQLLESRQFSSQEIARIFRIPPWMLGVASGDSLTYANVESQSLAFTTYSLRPWLVTIESALSADRDLFRAGTYCEFSLDALLRSDSLTRAQVYEKALDPITGHMTRAEVRQLENLPEEDEQPQTPAQVVAAMVEAPANGNGAPAPVEAG